MALCRAMDGERNPYNISGLTIQKVECHTSSGGSML